MTLADRIQRAMIRTSPYPPVRWIYAAAYGAILLWLMMRARAIPEIRRLQWRAPHRGHRFGVSDLDVRAETTRLCTTQFFALCDRLADVLRPSSRAMKVLDFYLFGPDEAQLQQRLGPISFGDSRLIRLLGPKTQPASEVQQLSRVPENAMLCRAMYEYSSLLQEVFAEDPSLHFTWKIFRRFKRIDQGFASRGGALDSESAPIRERMRERADRIVAGGAIRELEPSELEELLAVMLGELDAIPRPSRCHGKPTQDSIFRSAGKLLAPETLSNAIDSCSPQVNELCAELVGTVQSAILGCVPAANFDYRLYLIVRDDLTMHDRIEVFRAIRAMYSPGSRVRHIPSTYLRLRYPIVLTPAMWRASARWYHAVRPVEECFFIQRHGVVLCGLDVRGEVVPPADIDVIRSAAIAAADLRNLIWSAVRDGRSRRLVDLLLGRVPALWLLLTQSIIASSCAEAIAECAAADLPNVSVLEELHEKLGAMIPEQLPGLGERVWKPALDASSRWIDAIVQLAVARLDACASDDTSVAQG